MTFPVRSTVHTLPDWLAPIGTCSRTGDDTIWYVYDNPSGGNDVADEILDRAAGGHRHRTADRTAEHQLR